MRTFLRFLLLCLAVSIVACPRPPARHQYTSADLRSGDRLTGGLFDGVAPTSAAGGESSDAVDDAARDVVEPDVIRRAGHILYILNQYRGLTLVDLDADRVLAQVPTVGYPRDLYIDGSRAYVLVGQAGGYVTTNVGVSFSLNSRLYAVDISNPEAPTILDTFDLEGDLVDSRLVGNVLYAVGAEYQWGWVDSGGWSGAEGGAAVRKAQMPGSWVTSINIADPANIYQADQLAFPGQGTVIQASSSAIFVASPDWSEGTTSITYVDISDPAGGLRVRGSATVPGHVADRFKMDAFDGVLRVVSSSWNGERQVHLTTLDLANPDAMTPLAELEFETARGDSLFATRFDGTRGYVVTYFQVDPLYVLDLTDPAQPKISGELEVPGWSTHIEPMGDRLLALGVDDTQGRRVSVSLFDVSEPSVPSLIERVTFGDTWSWSTAYSDVKSFAVFDDVAVIPFSGWSDQGGGYERLQFVSFSRDDLALRGHVDIGGAVLRTIEYAGAYRAVTAEELATIDASNLDAPIVTKRLALAENVIDYVELTPDVAVRIVARQDGATVVKTVDRQGHELGSTSLDVGSLEATHAYGDSVVLAGTKWEWGGVYYGKGRYEVAVVDCSSPTELKARSLSVPIEPYYGYYPIYWAYGDVALSARGADIAPWWQPWQAQELTFLLGDTLALRGTATAYTKVVGDATPTQGLALVSLGNLTLTSTLGLGFEGIVSVNQAGDKLMVGSRVDAGRQGLWPLCAYFVTAVDVRQGSAGPTVNVPGSFLQYDPVSHVLLLRDDQWTSGGKFTSTLRTVLWSGDGITTLDDQALPANVAQVLPRGGKVFLDAYADTYTLYAVTVSPTGALSLGSGVSVTSQWGNLIEGRGESAYVSLGANAVARYVFGTGTLDEMVEVSSPPSRIRFGLDRAYLILGYAGVAEMGL